MARYPLRGNDNYNALLNYQIGYSGVSSTMMYFKLSEKCLIGVKWQGNRQLPFYLLKSYFCSRLR